MDTGKGNFEHVNNAVEHVKKVQELVKSLEAKYPQHGGWFREGEIIELRGSKFRVKAVKPTQIILKLLPRYKQGETQ